MDFVHHDSSCQMRRVPRSAALGDDGLSVVGQAGSEPLCHSLRRPRAGLSSAAPGAAVATAGELVTLPQRSGVVGRGRGVRGLPGCGGTRADTSAGFTLESSDTRRSRWKTSPRGGGLLRGSGHICAVPRTAPWGDGDALAPCPCAGGSPRGRGHPGARGFERGTSGCRSWEHVPCPA